MATLETLYEILDEMLVSEDGIISEKFWAVYDLLIEVSKMSTPQIENLNELLNVEAIGEKLPIGTLDEMVILPYFNKIVIGDYDFDTVVSDINITRDPSYNVNSKHVKSFINGEYIINKNIKVNIPITGYVISDGDDIVESEISTVSIPDGYYIGIRRQNNRIEYTLEKSSDLEVVSVERTPYEIIEVPFDGQRREYKIVNT